MNNAEKVLSRHGLIEMTQERFPFTKRWRDSELVRRIVWFPDDSAEHADDVFPYKERMFFSSLWKLGAKGIYWNTFHFLTQGIYALRRVICKYDDYCGFNNIARAYNFAIDNPRHFISFLDGVEYTGEIRTQMEIPELPSPHVGVLLRNDAWAKKYRQTLLEGIETVPNEPVNEITRQISLFGEEAEEIYAKALSSQ